MKVMVPGSFDPPTNGHLDIIKRAATLFDSVCVVVAHNSLKKPSFTTEERVNLLKECLSNLNNVYVDSTSSLVASYAKEHNINVIVRGVRNSSDYDYESELASANRLINKNLEFVFLPSSEEYRILRSSLVRELIEHDADVSLLVPPPVCKAVKDKLILRERNK